MALSIHNERRGNTAKRGLDGSVCEKRAEEEESEGGGGLLYSVSYEGACGKPYSERSSEIRLKSLH